MFDVEKKIIFIWIDCGKKNLFLVFLRECHLQILTANLIERILTIFFLQNDERNDVNL